MFALLERPLPNPDMRYLLSAPLAAMKNILVTGDTSEVFDGVCGAPRGLGRSYAGSPRGVRTDTRL